MNSETSISILFPTRGRPKQLQRLFDSIYDTTKYLNRLEVVIYVDDDDNTAKDISTDRFSLKIISGPRKYMGYFLTKCFEKSTGDIIMLGNDDMVLRTMGWDEKLLSLGDKYQDGIYLAHGNDLHMGETLSPFPLLSRKTVELMQDPFPEAYKGGFLDFHIYDIFKRLEKLGEKRIDYYPDLVFEHLHVNVGKSEMDDTYKWRGEYDIGDDVFTSHRNMRQSIAQRLYSHIHNTPLPMLIEPVKTKKYNSTRLVINILNAVRFYMFDSSLPGKWRFDMFMLFFTRAFAKAGYKVGRGYMRAILKVLKIDSVPWAR